MNNQQAAQRLSLVAQSAAKRGWLPATGGNLSAKTDSGYVVSASGVEKSRLSAEQFLQFDRAFQLTQDRGYAPSAETALHFKLYQLFAKAQSVLHVHSVTTTVLSMLIPQSELVMSGYEMQKTLQGISSHAQSINLPIFDNNQDMQKLALEVEDRFIKQPFEHAILIRGHGLYVWGQSIEKTQLHLEGLEFLLECELMRLQVIGKI